MHLDNIWIALLLFGFGGLGAGVGLVIGVSVVRMMRRYLKDEDNGKHK